MRTYYTTAADLAARCHRAALEGRWANTMRFYLGPSLLIIDEVGYLPLPGEAATALFQVVSQRYLKGSIALTTNLGTAIFVGQGLQRRPHDRVGSFVVVEESPAEKARPLCWT
jgi:DNA replication protein DnaC